ERAWAQIGSADAVLFLHDLTRTDDEAHRGGDRALLDQLASHVPSSVPVLSVWNKDDAAASATVPEGGLRLSAKTGAGLQSLRQRLLEVAGWQAAPEGVYIARERHLQALRRVDEHLMEAAAHLGAG